jgi:hypothetical protein
MFRLLHVPNATTELAVTPPPAAGRCRCRGDALARGQRQITTADATLWLTAR